MFVVMNAALYQITGEVKTRAFNVGRIVIIEECNPNEVQAGFNAKFTYQDGDNEQIKVFCLDDFDRVMKNVNSL